MYREGSILWGNVKDLPCYDHSAGGISPLWDFPDDIKLKINGYEINIKNISQATGNITITKLKTAKHKKSRFDLLKASGIFDEIRFNE